MTITTTTNERICKEDGSNYFEGDDLQVQRDVSNVEQTDALIKAWFTIKRRVSEADPGILQKIITTSVGAAGQIVQDGSPSNGDGTASFFFQLTAADTSSLGHLIDYAYDIQVKTDTGKIYTAEKGQVHFSVDVTQATT